MAVTRKRAARQQVTKPQPAEVGITRAHPAALAAALQLAGGDSRRLRAALEADGRVSVTVINHPAVMPLVR